MDLLKEYPLLIWNPTQGKHILALWWTYNEQHHVIVSTDQAGALFVFKTVMDKEREAMELRQYVEATLVPCPLHIAEKWAQKQYEQEFSSFGLWISYAVGDAYEKTKTVPEGFSYCPHQENSRARWDCKTCEGVRVFANPGVLEAMFEAPEIRELYRHPPSLSKAVPTPAEQKMIQFRLDQAEKEKEREKKRPKAVPAILTTEPLPLDLPLRVSVLNGGNHQPGVEFLDAEEWVKYPGLVTNPILFFFQGNDTTVPAPFRDLIEAAKKAKEGEEKRRMAEIKANRRDMKQEAVDLVDLVVRTYSAAVSRR